MSDCQARTVGLPDPAEGGRGNLDGAASPPNLTDPPPHELCGKIVIASMIDVLNVPDRDRPKPRPVMVIDREDGHYNVVAFTTHPAVHRWANGRPRSLAVPDHRAVGLRHPSYIRSPRLERVCVIDVDDLRRPIGSADWALTELAISNMGMRPDQRRVLREATYGLAGVGR